MSKIMMEFERGGKITGSLFEDKAPKTCQSILESLPVKDEMIHAIWAGEEIFFQHFPATFEHEQPTTSVDPGALTMVPDTSIFCIFYGKAIPRAAADEPLQVTVFGQVDDVESMAEIGRRVRMKGAEKVRITKA